MEILKRIHEVMPWIGWYFVVGVAAFILFEATNIVKTVRRKGIVLERELGKHGFLIAGWGPLLLLFFFGGILWLFGAGPFVPAEKKIRRFAEKNRRRKKRLKRASPKPD